MQFSNEDKDVFLVKIDSMLDRGALLSRYSRAASLDIREIYRKEFEGNAARGKDFYKRVFLEYGDESISELVTAQMAVQNISNILTKSIEDLRVGLSYLEKSSRYVRYDKKVNGRYLYLDPEKAGVPQSCADDYASLCDSLFGFYANTYDRALEFFREKYPIESIVFNDPGAGPQHIEDFEGDERKAAEKSYTSSVRARALDDLRSLLPASTLTNLGISGNGRSFINLIQRLKTVATPEALNIAESMYRELEQELPELINSAISKHGMELIQYRKEVLTTAIELPEQETRKLPEVELVKNDDDHEALVNSLSILAFSNGDTDLLTARRTIDSMKQADLNSIVQKLAGLRKNRRHKLHRAFESVPYLFQITTNYGAFRDLQRHRFISINRQPLSDRYGFDMPPLFEETSLREEYTSLMTQASEVYRKILKHSSRQIAQYAIPYAYRYPVSALLDLREAAFFCEIRSTPQAHPDLRKIAIDMYMEIQKSNPSLAPLMKFVDQGEYSLGRLKSEQNKERRLRDLNSGSII